MQPLAALGQAVLAAAPHDVPAEVDVDGEQLLQPHGPGLPVDERDVVDGEGVLHRGQLVQLLEDRLGVEAVLDLDDQLQSGLAVGEVLDVGDALQLLRLHRVLDLLDDLFGADEVGQLGDDDALAARRDLVDARRRAGAEAAAPGEVGVADAVEADDPAAAGQVRAGDELHQVVEAGVGVGQQVPGRADDLDEVVRRHVGRHADGDAGGAVDEEVGVGRGQHLGLQQLVVVVGDEGDGVLVEPGHHEQRRGGHPGLGVAAGGRAVVEGAEVAVAVDERQAHGEGLGHAHEGVVDRRVAVRVVLAHDLADDARGLHVAALGAQAHLAHRVEDAAVHRLEAVTGVGQGARVDHRVAVLEEGIAHLVRDVDVDDPLGRVDGWGGGRTAGHAGGDSSWAGADEPTHLPPSPLSGRDRHT